jgi:SAM-dependent methyltransferase
MSEMIDQKYLLSKQYNTSHNLNARIQLHERYSTNPINWHRWVFDQLQIPTGSLVLELGTGSAQLWLNNLDRIPADCNIVLSDFSPGMLEDARQRLADSASRFQFAVIDAQAIPFADDSFDYVIANHMLYHVPDRVRAFAEIRRVLTPQGRFYATTNGETYLSEMKQLCVRAGIALSGMLDPSSTSIFSLENGTEQMLPWFSHVDLVRVENSLAVTAAEPLIAFILACVPPHEVDDAKIMKLRALIEQELAAHGAVNISKDTGLLVAFGDASR